MFAETKSLVLVESYSKGKTISQLLGRNFLVLHSAGHVYQVKNEGVFSLGINWERLFPYYVIKLDRRRLLEKIITTASGFPRVIIATDPDREGEAIAWNLFLEIKKVYPKKKVFRARFNEVSLAAINFAFKHLTDINMRLVDSQAARIIVDRVIGFLLSRYVNLLVSSKLRSVGRVQSPALKFIWERDEKIKHFVPKHWFDLVLETKEEVNLYPTSLSAEQQNFFLFQEIKRRIENQLLKGEVKVFLRDLIFQKKIIFPPLFFSTVSLYQELSKKYSFSSEKSAKILQQLYEGVQVVALKKRISLITYHRTDSVFVSRDFAFSLKEFIVREYGFNNLRNDWPKYINRQFSGNRFSFAHEAIRPVNLFLSPDKVYWLGQPARLVYKTIYERTIAVFLKVAEVTKASWTGVIPATSEFCFTINFLEQPGFFLALGKVPTWIFPKLKFSKVLNANFLSVTGVKLIKKSSSSPSLLTESELLKKLKRANIGRPSTYASITEKLIFWGYIERRQRGVIRSTARGKFLLSVLDKKFPFVSRADYTSELENSLELVAEGKKSRQDVLKNFFCFLLDQFSETKWKNLEVFVKKVRLSLKIDENNRNKRLKRVGKES